MKYTLLIYLFSHTQKNQQYHLKVTITRVILADEVINTISAFSFCVGL